MNITNTTRLPAVAERPVQQQGSPVVFLAASPWAMVSPGGGEIQMTALADALPGVGAAPRVGNSCEQLPPDTDCLHLFGSAVEHLPLVEAARRRDVPVVLSTIAWFDWVNCLREPGPLWQRLAATARFLARAAYPWLPSWRRRLYHEVDLLLPNSNAEANQLMRYFGVPSEKIHIVPNGAEPRFATADPEPFRELVGASNFVLYAGRIEPRKNQLGFLRAMRGVNVPVVVLGDVVPGHESYLAQCRKAADHHVRFLPRLEHDDPMLASAYAACGCLVLVSWFETPGLAALEAAMSGTPLVLPIGGSAGEYFGPLAEYVGPNDLAAIRLAVLAALARGRNDMLAELTRHSFSWATAARATREAYGNVL